MARDLSLTYVCDCPGDAHILVTTDLAARGLDELDVRHVVQFDFAKSAADYVHRCGRTARAGKAGEVTSLVTKHDTELVRAIREATKRGEDLVAAGEAHSRTQRARAATELQPVKPQRPKGGGRGAASGGSARPAAAAAAFPDCRGISTHEPQQQRPGGSDKAQGRGNGGGSRGRGASAFGRGRGGSKARRSKQAAR